MDLQPTESKELKRGIAPKLLTEQVRNTTPYLFTGAYDERPNLRYVHLLRATAANPGAELSHVEYLVLCLSAHWATVGTFVPTDVDNTIRFKLWNPILPTETLVAMADVVIESSSWDFLPFTTRWVRSSETQRLLSGHHGEWFSVAAAAYGALRRRAPEKAAEVAGLIFEEVRREAEILLEFKRARDAIGFLKAATLMAHNLGDLDRVIEMWNIPSDDALHEAVFKAGHERGERFGGGILVEAGEVNKAHMADENHRHFALRKPRPLRRNADFLLPVGPFFDDWGMRIGRHPGLKPEEVGEITEALIDGWEKLPKTVGYPRALAGILEVFPGGLNALSDYLPAKVARTLKAGPLRSLCSVSRKRFEEQWSSYAFLKHAKRS